MWFTRILLSADLRLIALIVILLRAGFELSKDTLSRVGVMALLLSFVPASFEIAVITFLGPYFLGLTVMESAILGAVLGAVSPAGCSLSFLNGTIREPQRECLLFSAYPSCW